MQKGSPANLRNSARGNIGKWGTKVLLLLSLSGCFSQTDFVLSEGPGLLISSTASWLASDLTTVPADGTSQAIVKVYVRSKTSGIKTGQTVVLTSSRGSADTITAISPVTDSAGAATFRIKSLVPGTPTLIGTVGKVIISRTVQVAFTAANPVKLAFSAQPSATLVAGSALPLQPQVKILDSMNNVVTTSTQTITLNAYSDASCTTAIATTPDGTATVGGTASLAATAGTATFTNIQVNRSGSVYLQASASGLTSACSQLITVSPGAFSLADSDLSASAGTVAAGASVTLTLTAKDLYGNPAPSGVTTVAISQASGAGAGTYGTVTNGGGGVYTVSFTGTVAGLVTSQATINGSTVTDTADVTVTAGTKTKLAFSIQPSTTNVAGANLAAQPEVKILDAANNVVGSATDSISLSAFSDSNCTTAIATTPSGSATLGGTLTLAATAGVSAFSGISANRAGAVYVKASASGLSSACSTLITVSPGAFSLADSTVTSSAATVASGSAITITMTGKDAYGNANPSGITTVAFSGTTVGGTGSFASVSNAGSGVYTASFTGQVAGLVTISSTINSSNVTDTENVTVTNGSATKLAFTVQPSATNTAGSTLATQPKVEFEDAVGNRVTSETSAIAIAAYSDSSCTTAIATTPSGSNTLSGTLSVAAVSGLTTFSGIGAHRAGNVYLKASSGSLTDACSQVIAVSSGAFSLADSTVTTSSTTVASGGTVTITLTGKDAYGNASPSGMTTIVFSKASGAGDGTFGTVTNAGSGVYTNSFTGSTSGLVTIQSTINGSTVTDTENVTVGAGAATQLVFTTEPAATATAGTSLTTQPVVEIRDGSNNVVGAATDSVTLAAYSDASCSTAIATTPNASASVTGTATLAAVSGVATFTNIKTNYAGTVYLRAAAGSLTTDCSQAITVSPGAVSLADSQVTSSAATVNAGASVTVTLTGKDAYGNTNPSGMSNVVFSQASGAGSGTFGTVTDAGSGVYTNSLTGVNAGLVRVRATINGSAVTDKEDVTVNPGAATKLIYGLKVPESETAGSDLTTQPIVYIADASNNVVTSATDTVALAAYSDASCSTARTTTPNGSNTLGGTLSVAASGGSVTFSGIKANYAGSVYIKATSGSLTAACSPLYTVSPGAFSLADTTVTSSAATVASGASVTITLTGKDVYGNDNPTGMTTIAFSSSTVGGTGTLSAVTNAGSGVYTATFTGQVAGLVTISSTINSTNVTDTENVTVTAGAATKLVYTTQPAPTPVAGTVLPVQPVVTLQDANGNTVTSANNTVVLSAYSDASCTTAISTAPDGSPTLARTQKKIGRDWLDTAVSLAMPSAVAVTPTPPPSTMNASSGVAAFSGIKINRAGTVYLKASSGSLTTDCSALVTVSPGAINVGTTTLAVSATTVVSGSSITATLTMLDAFGNANPSGVSNVTFQSTTNAGTGSYGSITDQGGGVFTVPFTGALVGVVTLSAKNNGTAITQTKDVTVTAASATKLVFATAPDSSTTAGSAFSTQPVVNVTDASGNIVTSRTDTVTLGIYSDASCSTAVATTFNSTASMGNPTKAAVAGVATFTNTTPKYASNSLYFGATASGLTLACTAASVVNPGSADLAQSTLAVSAASVASGASITATATARDAYGNPTCGGFTTPSFVSTTNAGTGTWGTATACTSGVSTNTFTGQLAGAVTLTAKLDSASITQTQAVTVTTGAATQLVFSTQPGDGPIGSALITQPVVKIVDAGGNTVSSTANVTLSIGSGTGSLGGTATVAAVGGIATFSGLSVSLEGAKTLAASATVGGAISGTSNSFRVVKVAHTSPAAATLVNNANLTTVTLTGTCSEDTRTVSVAITDIYGYTGWTAPSTTCSSGTFSVGLGNLTPLVNGTLTVTVSHTSAGGATHSYTTTLNKQVVEVYVLAPRSGALITSENASTFNVKGYCSHNGQAVAINGGGVTSASPTCTNNAFSATLDFSSAANASYNITVDHSYSGTSAGQKTVSVTKKTCSWNTGGELVTAPVNNSCHTSLGSNRSTAVYVVKNAVGSLAANTWLVGGPFGLSISTDGGTTWTTKTTVQGLPHNNVNSVHVTAAGVIVLATNLGVGFSSDGGATWTKRTTSDGLPDNYILDVVSNGTTVYAGTDGKLSYTTDNGATWTVRTVASKVKGILIYNSKIYVATAWGLYISTDLTGSSFSGVGSYLPLRAIATDGSRLFLGSNSGLYVTTDMTGTSGTLYTWGQNVQGGDIQRIRVNSSGHIFVAAENGISKSTDNGATWTQITSVKPMDLFIDSSDVVYAATFNGFEKSTNGGTSFTTYASTNPLNNYGRAFQGDNWTRGTHIDSANNVFVLRGSMNQIRDTAGWGWSYNQDEILAVSSDWGASFQKFNSPWECSTPLSITPDRTGRIFMGCAEGLFIQAYDNSYSWRPARTTTHGLGSNRVNGTAFDSTGKLYAATNGGLSISTDLGVSFINKTTSDGLGSNTVYNVTVDSTGNVYAATAGGISISTNGGTSFTNRTTGNGLGSNTVYDVAVNASAIFAATAGGVSVSSDLTGASFTNRTTAAGLGSNTVTQIAIDSTRIYAATPAGLSVSTSLTGASFSTKGIANGLGSDGVANVVAGSNYRVFATGALWGGLQVWDTLTPAAATSLTWTTSSPIFKGSMTASWTTSTSTFTTQKIMYYRDSNCTTAATALTDVASASTHAVAFNYPSTFTYKITTVNGSVSTVSACSAPMVVKQTFYDGIAFGNDSTVRTINGYTWKTTAQAITAGLSFGASYPTWDSTGSHSTIPAASASVQGMLFHQHYSPQADLSFTYPLPTSGTYRIYVWEQENNFSGSRTANIQFEGTTYGANAMVQPLDEWQRYGPYDVSVTDGTLNVNLQAVGAVDPQISGLEIYRIDSGGTTTQSDDFSSGIQSPFTQFWTSPALQAIAASGMITVTPPASTSPNGAYDNTYAGLYVLAAPADFTNTGYQAEIPQMLNDCGGAADNFMELYLDGMSGNQVISFFKQGSNLAIRKTVNGSFSTLTQVTYNSTNHRFFRIHHDSNADWLIFETSPNGSNQWTPIYRTHPFYSITGTQLTLGAGVWSSCAAPGTMQFDNVSVIHY